MASTIGTVGRAVQPDEAVLNGMKRSRLSLHVNTRRVWHWISAQLVSVSMQTEDEDETISVQLVQFSGSQTSIVRLVDVYIASQFARRWA